VGEGEGGWGGCGLAGVVGGRRTSKHTHARTHARTHTPNAPQVLLEGRRAPEGRQQLRLEGCQGGRRVLVQQGLDGLCVRARVCVCVCVYTKRAKPRRAATRARRQGLANGAPLCPRPALGPEVRHVCRPSPHTHEGGSAPGQDFQPRGARIVQDTGRKIPRHQTARKKWTGPGRVGGPPCRRGRTGRWPARTAARR
jgi:hypothetical protein